MTLLLELPDNKEAALKAKAQSQVISAEQYVERMLGHDLEELTIAGPQSLPSIAHLQKTDPEEWSLWSFSQPLSGFRQTHAGRAARRACGGHR